jgi:hypothetical protein
MAASPIMAKGTDSRPRPKKVSTRKGDGALVMILKRVPDDRESQEQGKESKEEGQD